jgi:hypothetical protein
MSQKELKMVGQCGLNAVLLYVFSFFVPLGFPKAIHYIYIYRYIYLSIHIYRWGPMCQQPRLDIGV